MRIRHTPFLLPFLLLAACSSDHPLAGNWAQDTGSDKKGMNLGFDVKGNNGEPGTAVLVHTAPDAEGHHDHLNGTYTFDAATKAITVKCRLLGDAKADTWTGTLAGESLELTGGTDKLKFRKGGSAH